MVHRSLVAADGDQPEGRRPQRRCRHQAKPRLKLVVRRDPDDDPRRPGGAAALSPATDTDAALDALAVAAQRGDSSAAEHLFASVYTHVFTCLHALARWVLRDENAADDCCQEAFMSVQASLRTFDPAKGTFRKWIRRIVRNAAVKELKARVRRRMCSLEDLCADGDGGFACGEPLPLDVIVRNEAADRDRQWLDRHEAELSPPLRLGFAARRAGLTHIQLAAEAGVPANTARSWMFRAIYGRCA